MLENEMLYFNEHLSEWIVNRSDKFVLIKENDLIGFYNTFDEALAEGARRFGLVSFLVRQVTEKQNEINIPALSLMA
jgi:hypothetical protein